MVVYELYWLNSKGEHQMIGVLPERRKNPMRITKASVMNWGKMLLGDDADSKNIIFTRLTIESLADRILWHDVFNPSVKIIN